MEHTKPKLSLLRHIAKSITYRIYSSTITFLISYFVTGKASVSLSIGLFEFFIKIVSYFFHERLWYKINFGKKYLEKQKNSNDN